MTIHKSEAVRKGIMPDFAMAGVVLCRTAEVNIATEGWTVASSDTIQMVPIPKNAKILSMMVYNPTHFSAAEDTDIGYGGDPNAFFDSLDMSAYARPVYWPAHDANVTNAVTAGLLHTFTADDTIDIVFNNIETSVTLGSIKMAVYYKMTGVISDES